MPSLSLTDLMRAVQQDLVITVRHELWLLKNSNAVYSPQALSFAAKVISGELGGNRARQRSFRASGMGHCARARLFAYNYVTGIDSIESRTANIFATGNMLHLKWQLAGLTEGWLSEAEVPMFSEQNHLGGTADGILHDGSLFEFKSINARGYDFVTRNGPKWEHLLQTGAYKLLNPELPAASIVYENKNTSEWREYRVLFTDEVMEAVTSELADLNSAQEAKKMPKMLSACEVGEGAQFRGCPYRVVCPETSTWPKETS